MYVARYTTNPQADIERGWSGAGLGGGMTWQTIDEWATEFGIGEDYEDDLPERQQRWINTWGDEYEDWNTFYKEYLEERAQEYNLRYDEHYDCYRIAHHDGLSCFLLEATTLDEAINEAQIKNAKGSISWSGTGYATIGKVTLMAQVERVEDPLYIFKCDDAVMEV